MKFAGSNVSTKYFRFGPNIKIRVTVCNVLVQLNEDVFAAYLSKYGSVEPIGQHTVTTSSLSA